MAVTPMKLATIVGPVAEFDNVVLECVINKEFHPESASNVTRRVEYLYPFDINNPYAELLRKTESVAEHLEFKLDYRDFSGVEKGLDDLGDYLNALDTGFGVLLDEKNKLTRLIEESGQILEQLEHLRGINVDLSLFSKMEYVLFRFGRMPRDTFENILPLIAESNEVFFFPTSIEKNTVYGMYLTPRSAAQKVDGLFNYVQFIRSSISDRVHGNSDQAIQHINAECSEARRRLEELNAEIYAFKRDAYDHFLSVYSYIRLKNDSYNIRRFAAHTQESFYLLGWVPENEFEAFSSNISQKSPKSVVVTDAPEEIDDYTPPVKLKNNTLFKPYEPYVGIYGLPSYNEMDPTPLMAITYTLLFGIMFGDLGQGAVLALGGFVLWKLKKIWLARVAIYMGVSAMVFGLIYGSVFGDEELLGGFKVLHGTNSQTILQYSIYISLVVIGFVMLLNIINGIRQKNHEKIFFGPNGVAGLIFYFSFMGIMLPFIGFGKQVLTPVFLGLMMILPAILMFLREPLSKLAERRKDWKPHSKGDFIIENIFEMIEIVLSYLTNTISFLRVGAYAISHASMMAVVYMLAQTADGGHNIVVLIIGNIVILCLEALLAGIQVLRLEFYEMFSRFYSGDGRPYAPVIIDYRKRND